MILVAYFIAIVLIINAEVMYISFLLTWNVYYVSCLIMLISLFGLLLGGMIIVTVYMIVIAFITFFSIGCFITTTSIRFIYMLTFIV